MKIDSVKIVFAGVGLSALAWLALQPRGGSQSAASIAADSAAGSAVASKLSSTGESAAVAKVSSGTAKATALKASRLVQGAAAVSTSVKLAPEVQERLAMLTKIEHKVFTSEGEKSLRALSLHDDSFLRQIAGVLTSRSLDPATLTEQNQAVDTLLAAQAAGSSVATELLKSVVTDAQVEDATVPREVRENLAGVKAEVMYKWSAADASAPVASALPGPVSQRIWANVQDKQARNVAESNTLKR